MYVAFCKLQENFPSMCESIDISVKLHFEYFSATLFLPSLAIDEFICNFAQFQLLQTGYGIPLNRTALILVSSFAKSLIMTL